MDIEQTHRGLTQGDDSRRQSGWSTRTIRWINRAVSAGLLITATVMGVQFGMDAPTVSPVSPPAIAAQAALLTDKEDLAQAMPVEHNSDHHQRRGRS